jgi:hypothetical protein
MNGAPGKSAEDRPVRRVAWSRRLYDIVEHYETAPLRGG